MTGYTIRHFGAGFMFGLGTMTIVIFLSNLLAQ